MVAGELYWWGFSSPLPKCLNKEQADYIIRELHELLHLITTPWPFSIWGMDILGPFPVAMGKHKFLLVVVNYFTKRIEAEPLATITTKNVQKFLCIITHFSITCVNVTNNGLHFVD